MWPVPLCAEPTIRSEFSVLNRGMAGGYGDGPAETRWTIERASAQLRVISPGLFEATLPAEFDPGHAKHFLGYN